MSADFYYLTNLPIQVQPLWNLQICTLCGSAWRPGPRTLAVVSNRLTDGTYVPPVRCPICDSEHWQETVEEWLERVGAGDLLDNRLWLDHTRAQQAKLPKYKRLKPGARMSNKKRKSVMTQAFGEQLDWAFGPWREGLGRELFLGWVQKVIRRPQVHVKPEECGVEYATKWWRSMVKGWACTKGFTSMLPHAKLNAQTLISEHRMELTFPSMGPAEHAYLPPVTRSWRRLPLVNGIVPVNAQSHSIVNDGTWPNRAMAMFWAYSREFEAAIRDIHPGLVVEMIGMVSTRRMTLRVVMQDELDRLMDLLARKLVTYMVAQMEMEVEP